MTEERLRLAENATLADRLGRIERLETEIMCKASALAAKSEAIFHSDMFVIGAVRRTIAQSKGFRDLITAKNFPCAAAILRMQLDTAMRVNALVIVEKRDTCYEAILRGKRFNTLKDFGGNKLTDAYLRKKLAEKYPWISTIYEETSDFVHLSGRHFYSSIFRMDDDTGVMTLYIGGTDPPRPEANYFEIVDAFFDVSRMMALMLLGYFAARAGVFEESETETSEP